MLRLFICGLLTLLSVTVCAQETTVLPATSAVVVSSPEIVTTAPAPKETIVIPSGYQNCFTVKAGWYQNVWIAEHQVCQYSSSSTSGAAWVNGYWSCTKYNSNQCINWEWVSGHWQKTLVVY